MMKALKFLVTGRLFLFGVFVFLFLYSLTVPALAIQPGEDPRCTQNCTGIGAECIIWECSLCDVCEEWRQSLPWFDKTSQQYDQNLNEDAQTNNVSMLSYEYATIQGIVQGIRRTLVGSSVPSDENTIISRGGAVGATGRMIGTIYQHSPASSIEYLAYVGEKAGFIPKAYAQGTGFRGFFPLIKVWSAMRNAAYLFFAFVLIVIGVLIIFRVKVDPRTVVTVQIALPKIVISLILVTFSYAIVGLLVDVMNVVIGVLVWLFTVAGLIKSPEATITVINEWNVLAVMAGVFGGGVGGALSSLIGGILGGVAKAISVIGTPIIELILAITLISAVFKLLFSLIMAYVSVILSVLLAPLQIALNAIPNLNTFKSWFLNLAANLSVFPTVATMLLLAAALTGRGGPLGVEEFPGLAASGWRPPLIGGGGRGGLDQEAITTLIGFGIILMTPGMIDQVKKLFQVPPADMSGIGAGVGAGIGPAKSAGLGLARIPSGAAKSKLGDYFGARSGSATGKFAPKIWSMLHRYAKMQKWTT